MFTTLSSNSPNRVIGKDQYVIPRAWRTETTLLCCVLAGFALFGFWYSMVTPPFETPDEVYHYAFVRHVAQGNGLPVQQATVDAPWEQEGSQAPLYYLLVGWLTRGIDQSDFEAISVRNPRANIGDPLFDGNKNFMLYSAIERPLRGANLALHIGRWVSLCLGVITLWLTYLTVKIGLENALYALIVTLWVAAIPQFAFISAACSNDSMIIAASAATIYWLARLLVKPVTESISVVEWSILGVLLGIAALSKLQGLGLVGLAGVVVIARAWQQQNWRIMLNATIPIALPALLIAGWWYGRNLMLYGDLFGISYLLSNNGLRTDPISWGGLWGELRGLRYSFWGLFGWFNLLLPRWIYHIFDGLTIVALLGLVLQQLWGPSRTTRGRILLCLALFWAVLSLLLLAYWISQATGSQGRLLFPAIGVVVYLMVDGLRMWAHLLPPSYRPVFWLIPPMLLVGSSIFALTILFPRTYAAPLAIATLPNDLPSVDLHYRGTVQSTDEIRLLGLELPTERYRPGERVPVTLYLQADQPIQDDYQLFIQFLNEERTEVGNLTSHPGWGRNPTSLWQSGAIYADHYPVLINQRIDNRSPLLATVYVGFVNPATEKSGRFPIAAYDQNGQALPEPFVGEIAISPLTQPSLADIATDDVDVFEIGTQFGDVIQLSAVTLPNTVNLSNSTAFTTTLLWDAIGTPAADYTAFVHLIDRNSERATGFDQAPALRFPTRYWRNGDRIISKFAMPTPPLLNSDSLEDYAIWVGLYEMRDNELVRLPITNAAGQVAGDGQVLVRERR